MTFNDLEGQKYIAYDAYGPNMSMHAKNQVNQCSGCGGVVTPRNLRRRLRRHLTFPDPCKTNEDTWGMPLKMNDLKKKRSLASLATNILYIGVIFTLLV